MVISKQIITLSEITLTASQPNQCSGVVSEVVGTMYITVEEPTIITNINIVKNPICENGTIDLTAVLAGQLQIMFIGLQLRPMLKLILDFLVGPQLTLPTLQPHLIKT